MKIGGNSQKVYKVKSTELEHLIHITKGDSGKIIDIIKSKKTSKEPNWVKVETKKKIGYIILTEDIILTTYDLINSENLNFNPKEVINLPTSIIASKLPKDHSINSEILSNKYKISFINENIETGNLILTNDKNELFTFPNNTYLKQNTFENNLIFQGYPKFGELLPLRAWTVLNLRKKILEINYSSQDLIEQYNYEEGYSIPYNQIKIIPGKYIFIHNINYDFHKINFNACNIRNIENIDNCVKKEKISEYFLAISNIEDEPIFHFFENQGIPKRYSLTYKNARRIKNN